MYTQPGTYTTTLTVTDNLGAQGIATVQITAANPNVINAPANLRATASGPTAILRWTDTAGNESGFYVERAPQTGKDKGNYARVATVPANVIAYAETVSNGSYYYRVQAFNSSTGKVSVYSNVATVTVKNH